eukprot:3121478-Rhodomonas_salina.1
MTIAGFPYHDSGSSQCAACMVVGLLVVPGFPKSSKVEQRRFPAHVTHRSSAVCSHSGQHAWTPGGSGHGRASSPPSAVSLPRD